MLVPDQMVEVKITKKIIDHYKNLGYDIKLGDIIMVPPNHLTKGSHAVVLVLCDCCNKKYEKPYKQYLSQHTYDIDTCFECKGIKYKKTCIDKYGLDNVSKLDSVRDKVKNTFLNKYGVENILQNKDIQDKIKKTNIEKYGFSSPVHNEEIRKKIKATNLKRYGVENPAQSYIIREKMRNTLLERYGYDNPLACPEFLEKAIKTKCENGKVPTSKQQLLLYDIIKQRYCDAELNYPFSRMIFDIYIEANNVRIDIEYDGYIWHDQMRDERRDMYTKSQGIKILRIKSAYLLPDENELFNAINSLVNTDIQYNEIILSDWKGVDKNESMSDLTRT